MEIRRKRKKGKEEMMIIKKRRYINHSVWNAKCCLYQVNVKSAKSKIVNQYPVMNNQIFWNALVKLTNYPFLSRSYIQPFFA